MKKRCRIPALLFTVVFIAVCLGGCAGYIRIELLGMDPTLAAYMDAPEDFIYPQLIYFGFSDALLDMKFIKCEAARPKCMDTSLDFDYTDLTVDNITDPGQIRQIAYTPIKTRKKQHLHHLCVSQGAV